MDNLTSIPATLGSTSTIIVGGTGQFEVLEALASFGVQGAFAVQGKGLWEGTIEIATLVKVDGLTITQAINLAGRLRDVFKQDCVLLERDGEAYLV